ncbi:hypothetical protein CKAN_00142800 [Cinnamomum micranthum f. kanehirae]|uniref:GRF-type domain-containing protein n=1 Tax=Cinnamomum micranthum f. kanehirae TaxID=337451 RepID=A0A443N3T9_9MAGN|nr:hypothetical protein CKAN_00142800 [Cinnamomum micranthum f. kanehirae]
MESPIQTGTSSASRKPQGCRSRIGGQISPSKSNALFSPQKITLRNDASFRSVFPRIHRREVSIEPSSWKVLERMSSSNSRITKWAPKCPCGSGDMKLFTSHIETNPNRKFWRCPNWNDDGCDAFFWKDKFSREHPPSDSNSTPERDSRDLARTINGIKEALEAQNQIMLASIENENLRTMYLYKLHHLFVAICCVLVAMCCILVYMVFRV